jgi:hypothetical protein
MRQIVIRHPVTQIRRQQKPLRAVIIPEISHTPL